MNRPFINPNHGGGFAVFLTLWLLHSALKETDFSSLIMVLAVAFAGLTLLSLSRGAIAALAVGLAFGTVAPLLRLSAS